MKLLYFIRGALVFVMSYISFFQFLFGVSSIDELINDNLIYGIDKKYNSAIIGIVVLLLWIVCNIIIKIHEKKEQDNAGNSFHQIQHQFRDMVFELKKENDEYQRNGNVPSYEVYYNNVRTKARVICEEIEKFLKAYSGKNFNVCIKMIDVSSSRTTSSIKEMKIITLCRAGIDRIERSQSDASENISVADNSDFESILEKDGEKGSCNVFATNNLMLYYLLRKALRNPYKTSSKDFLKKYHSAMVVPIRIAANKLPRNTVISDMNHYQVFGFLCIDYKKRISKGLMRKVLEYEKAFGDLMYIFFNEVLVGDTIISKANIKKNDNN